MPYEYEPLRRKDIRVLTIDAVEDDASSDFPICCRIEHANLSLPSRAQPFKGQNYVWPETKFRRDVTTIFKDYTNRGSLSSTITASAELTNTSAKLQISEDSKPWRYEWGDFVALSYYWGPPSPVQHIILNNRPFPVGPNLFQALRHLRSHQRIRQGFKIWIDAICINQADIAERSAQVGRMREIYAAAWQVVIWLGPETDDSELAVTAASAIATQNRSPSPYGFFYRKTALIDCRPLFIKWSGYKSPLKKSVYKALFLYLSRPYWQRMWILQEVAMTRQDAPVVCGRSCLPWRDIHDAATFISNDEQRFGREVARSTRPRILGTWTFEAARDRVVQERRWASGRMWDLLIDMTNLQKGQNALADSEQGPKHPFDVLRPLILARDAEVTEEKDRVYGILGIKSIADRVDITPDYTLSLTDIYQDFTAQLISQGDLNILRFVSRGGGQIKAQWNLDNVPAALKRPKLAPILGPTLNSLTNSYKKDWVGVVCSHELPTWVICWTCRPAPTAQLRGFYQAGGKRAMVPPVFSPTDHTVVVKAVMFDVISNLSSFHPAEIDDTYPQNTSDPSANAYESLEATRDALWRSLLGDTTSEGGEYAPGEGSWLLDPRLWRGGVAGVYTNGFGLHEFMSRNKKLSLGGQTLEQLIFGVGGHQWRERTRTHERVYDTTEKQHEVLSWAMNATAWRRLICTANGRIGLAPAAARAEDKLAVFPGCSTPMVLRRSANSWEVVGECYIHGVMDGIVLDAANEVEDFTLC
ncbi:HET-domain-containing protein [Polychaeton citri CBS 116435]|uniref:HET-domain-containing protein n=1 Tax=Polychaeton citri CBS 116435 TaxID=1314669 RepID=A0A9P4URV0_9PEZI|nr:HET-domain-containing protein [Polychaeton citri CBS 116435]